MILINYAKRCFFMFNNCINFVSAFSRMEIQFSIYINIAYRNGVWIIIISD